MTVKLVTTKSLIQAINPGFIQFQYLKVGTIYSGTFVLKNIVFGSTKFVRVNSLYVPVYAPCPPGKYTFSTTCSRLFCTVKLLHDGVLVSTLTYSLAAILGSGKCQPYSFDFGSKYFSLEVEKSGTGTATLSGIDKSMFGKLSVLNVVGTTVQGKKSASPPECTAKATLVTTTPKLTTTRATTTTTTTTKTTTTSTGSP